MKDQAKNLTKSFSSVVVKSFHSRGEGACVDTESKGGVIIHKYMSVGVGGEEDVGKGVERIEKYMRRITTSFLPFLVLLGNIHRQFHFVLLLGIPLQLWINITSNRISSKWTPEEENMRFWAMDRIMFPATALLNTKTSPFMLSQGAALWERFSKILWQNHMTRERENVSQCRDESVEKNTDIRNGNRDIFLSIQSVVTKTIRKEVEKV
jgi:hypothetical protein